MSIVAIEGGKEEQLLKKQRKRELYFNALSSKTFELEDDPENLELQKQYIFYAVKYIISSFRNKETEASESMFYFGEFVKDMLSRLTPREVMNMFPVEKDFDGHKYGCKDYFFTMKAISNMDIDKPIGKEKFDSFLWNYLNRNLQMFQTKVFFAASELYKNQTGKGIMETWLNEKGVASHNRKKEVGGKEYMVNRETGEKAEIKKRIPRYLKLVKGDKQ